MFKEKPVSAWGNGRGSKPMVPFWGFGAPPMLVYFTGDWDVHWGYDLGFDPWPNDGEEIEPV